MRNHRGDCLLDSCGISHNVGTSLGATFLQASFSIHHSMKKIILSCSCFILAVACTASLAPAKEAAANTKSTGKRHYKKGKTPTPASLVKDMRAAVAYIAREGKKDLNIKSKQQRPFWAGLKLVNESLDQMQAGIKAKDAKMLTGLNGVGRGVEMLGTSWGVLRGSEKDSKVGRGIMALYKSYQFFGSHYGPTVARYKQGGSVRASEKSAFAKSQALRKKLSTSLTKLQAKAPKNSLQARLVADLLRQLLDMAQFSADSLDGYCAYTYHWGRFETAFYAYNDCIEVWYPEFYSSWKSTYSDYTLISTIFTANSWSSYSNWDYTADAVESYGDYYESTVSVEKGEASTSESFVESYAEASATEEVAAEVEELEEEYTADAEEEEEESFADSAMDESDDADADGVDDEEDADDDNDGVEDESDTDDDGDNVPDGEDTDMDEDADEDSGDSDDDGIADAEDGDDDNDGTMDADDGDDDGDGVDDGADMEGEAEAEAEAEVEVEAEAEVEAEVEAESEAVEAGEDEAGADDGGNAE